MSYIKIKIPTLTSARRVFNRYSRIILPIIAIVGISFFATITVYRFQAAGAQKKVLGRIEADTHYLVEQGNQIAADPNLAELIQGSDQLEILGYLTRERDARKIGLMGVTDANGNILTRTKSVSKRGDNVLLTNPIGRAVANSDHISSIEVSGVDPTQLLITTARHVKSEEKRVGTLFANYLTDDSYANQIKQDELRSKDHLIFYTNAYGVYGSTLKGDESESMKTQLTPGSDWIQDRLTDRTINIKGKTYWVKNVSFPGLEHSPGGVVILVSLNPIIPILLTMLSVALCYYLRKKLWPVTETKKEIVVTVGSQFTVSLILISIALLLSSISINANPYTIYNSTLRIQPDATVITEGSQVTSSVRLDSGGEEINSIELNMQFDASLLAVSEIVTMSSICKLFPINTFDNTAGTITIDCGLPSPGFTGTSGIVADVVFQTKTTGRAVVTFTENTQVLANDGLGTNVLRNSTNAQYIIAHQIDKKPEGSPSSSPVSNGSPSAQAPTPAEAKELIVFSPSHPNAERWYNRRNVQLNWENQSHTPVDYAFNMERDTEPDGKLTTQADRLELEAPSDGIYYFHARYKNSPVTYSTVHYPVKIDTQPPDEIEIKASDSQPKAGQVTRFEFSAQDSLSGIQSNYYIRINGGIFLPAGKQISIPFDLPGKQNISVRVYDNANNIGEKQMTLFATDRLGILQSLKALWSNVRSLY